MTITLDRPAPPPPPSDDRHGEGRPPRRPARSALRPLLIRLHFLSGFLAAPIILSLALTGILFAWNPQIENLLHSDALSSSSPSAAPVPLREQVRAAQEARPDYTVTTVIPAAPDSFGGRETTAVAMAPSDAEPGAAFGHAAGALSVYVDPATGQVTGEIDEAKRPGEWLRNLHSSWRLGDNVAPLTELAASWLLVSMLTGLYLKFPAIRRSLRQTLFPRLRQPGWRRANAIHTALGVWLTVALLGLIATGLTWTSFAGSRVDDLKATVSSPVPSVSTTLDGAATPAGADAPAFAVNEAAANQIDTVERGAADADVAGLLKYTPPSAEGKAWKVEKRDQKFPMRPVTLAVDGTTGAEVDRVTWGERPLMARMTSMGISFHQAELFGLATQLYLTVITLGLIVLIAAGYGMWWLRRPPGSFGAPPRAGPLLRTVPVPMMIVSAVVIYALPTLGVSLLVYLAIERMVRAVQARRQPVGDIPAAREQIDA